MYWSTRERFGYSPRQQVSCFDLIQELRQAALANPIDAFKFVFDRALEGLFIDRTEQNDEITARFLNDEHFQQAVTERRRQDAYEQIRRSEAALA